MSDDLYSKTEEEIDEEIEKEKAKLSMASNAPIEELTEEQIDKEIAALQNKMGVFDMIDTYTGAASTRAATMALLKGENPITAFTGQYGEHPKFAPSGEDIMLEATEAPETLKSPENILERWYANRGGKSAVLKQITDKLNPDGTVKRGVYPEGLVKEWKEISEGKDPLIERYNEASKNLGAAVEMVLDPTLIAGYAAKGVKLTAKGVGKKLAGVKTPDLEFLGKFVPELPKAKQLVEAKGAQLAQKSGDLANVLKEGANTAYDYAQVALESLKEKTSKLSLAARSLLSENDFIDTKKIVEGIDNARKNTTDEKFLGKLNEIRNKLHSKEHFTRGYITDNVGQMVRDVGSVDIPKIDAVKAQELIDSIDELMDYNAKTYTGDFNPEINQVLGPVRRSIRESVGKIKPEYDAIMKEASTYAELLDSTRAKYGNLNTNSETILNKLLKNTEGYAKTAKNLNLPEYKKEARELIKLQNLSGIPVFDKAKAERLQFAIDNVSIPISSKGNIGIPVNKILTPTKPPPSELRQLLNKLSPAAIPTVREAGQGASSVYDVLSEQRAGENK